jgi:hypothetical protein
MVSFMEHTPVDLGSQAARNAELRRLFANPTVHLVDDETPGEFAVYVLDQQARRERCLGHLPGETLARLPDGAGPDGVALAFCCYRVGVDAGRAPDG